MWHRPVAAAAAILFYAWVGRVVMVVAAAGWVRGSLHETLPKRRKRKRMRRKRRKEQTIQS